MQIKTFLKKEIFGSRLDKENILVVYDSQHIYKEVCLELDNKHLDVIDCSKSSIESRETSYLALQKVADPQSDLYQIVIYIPKKAPETNKEKLADPFWMYAEMGSVFPDPSKDGDSYLQVCLKAKPENSEEIIRIFNENPIPSFDVLDAIGGGKKWPTLRSLLGDESVAEIIVSILKPSVEQKENLTESSSWITELKSLLKSTFNYSLKTESKSLNSIADELWRFMLYSEWVHSTGFEEPEKLRSIPRAPLEARHTIRKVCVSLRQDQRKRDLYIEKSKEVEESFSLASNVEGTAEEGVSYTFSFEERQDLKQTIRALLDDDLDKADKIIENQKESIWSDLGENQLEWQIIRSAYYLLRECGDRQRDYQDHIKSISALFDYYVFSFREGDKAQREFEQAWNEYIDYEENLSPLAEHVRKKYRSLIENVQVRFMDLVSNEGWPVSGKRLNADTFDKKVVKKVEQSGYRVAYIMTDALRYELAEILEKSLKSYGAVELEAVCAQLPTITPVGMASLLPNAGKELKLVMEDGKLTTEISGEPVNNVTQRMKVFNKRFGARFKEMPILDFVKKNKKVPKEVELLVLRSMEIDSHLESNPETTLKLIPDSLQSIQGAVNKLRKSGFKEVFIVTDHGFFLNHHAGPGDVCQKPEGNWAMIHDRMMIGDGDKDEQNVLIPAAKLGIKGNFPSVACPRSMAPYKAGELFFHGGLSLQEAIVPVLSLQLKEEKLVEDPVDIKISYRGGLEKINTRIPVFHLEAEKRDLFFEDDLEVKIVAEDKQGNIVGEVQPSGAVNPASGMINVKPGSGYIVKVILRMQEDFEGEFTVKVLNPETEVIYSTVSLETDYMV